MRLRLVLMLAALSAGVPGLAAAAVSCPPGLAFATATEADVLTIDEAAAFLKLPRETVREAAETGALPARKLLGEWRLLKPALVAWLAGIENPDACLDVRPRSAWSTVIAEGPVPIAKGDLARIDALGQRADILAQAARDAGEPAAQGAPAPAAPGAAPGQFGEAPEFDTARDVALRDESILGTRGKITLELDANYVRTDRQVGIPAFSVVGALAEQTTEAAVLGLTARYAATDRLELSAGGSVQETRQELKLGATSQSSEETRVGDVALGARYQIVRESRAWPGLVVSLDGRIPTDETNGYGLGGGISMVRRSDPAVLFAGVSYLHTFAKDHDDPNRLQPEDSVAARAGLSLALNDTLSVNGAFEFDHSEAAEFDNGFTLPDRQTYGLRFGVTTLINRNLYLEPTVRFQTNDVSNSVLFGVSIPYTF